MPERPIRVLIADDHPIVREGLRLVLARREDIDVVAEVDNGRDAVERTLHLRPRVAIIDLDMPELTGVAVIKEITRTLPECRCLVLTMHDGDDHLYEALAAGAAGYLVKGASASDIEQAVRGAAAGQVIIGAEVAASVTNALTAGRPTPGRTAFPHLSDRDLEILDRLAQGLDNSTIARQLHLAPKTIRNQVSALIDKLEATDRADAIRLARAGGLGARTSQAAGSGRTSGRSGDPEAG
jgi:DNA-binding NarL/FixJ family response regulator